MMVIAGVGDFLNRKGTITGFKSGFISGAIAGGGIPKDSSLTSLRA